MTINREVFAQDPTNRIIPNEGVARVGMPGSDQEWGVLRYELESFVCEGEYRAGLHRILNSFLTGLTRDRQSPVWVSGFYGSGKSHLVRVLDALWQDITFPDSATARGLVNPPTEISDLLKELTTAGHRVGGVWSAAGTLNAGVGTSVQLATLRLAFQAAGLPADYGAARLILWLKRGGHLEQVRQFVSDHGCDLEQELGDLYVSPVLAEALSTTIPTLPKGPGDVSKLLTETYPHKTELAADEFIATLEAVLASQSNVAGKLPLVLIVLDELQEFLNDDLGRIGEVREMVELCSAKFGSHVLFVATGQMELTGGGSALERLQDRFSVKVTLSDRDVERVVREVVLRKNPAREAEVSSALGQVAGEIGRHLGGTRIAPTQTDGPDLVPDYPLLPTRRRFWAGVFRSVGHVGHGQLRTQLRVVHETVKGVVDEPLGSVVPGDALFAQIERDLEARNDLPRETDEVIRRLDDGSPDGGLKMRCAMLVFLIGKLETQGPSATGVKATAGTLADLLVEDLNTGSQALRQQLPALLVDLCADGVLLDVGGEYRIQTKESADWEQEFRRQAQALRLDNSRLAGVRSEQLGTLLKGLLATVKPQQGTGTDRVTRKVEQDHGPDAPKIEASVPIWVRDGWSVEEDPVRTDAQQAGTDSPTVFVHIPRMEPDAIINAIVEMEAAQATLGARPAPTTEPGREARLGMQARRQSAEDALKQLAQGVVNKAKVWQGGGVEVKATPLAAALQSAAQDAVGRLFPKFDIANQSGWERVREKARQGAPDALKEVGHLGDADSQPVCREVLTYVGPAGKKGAVIRNAFVAPPYGWSQDAIDGALLALMAGGFLRARLNGKQVGARELPQNQMGSADYAVEGVVVQAGHRVAIRALGAEMGYPIKSNEELEAVPVLLDRLRTHATEAGGEPPIAARPATAEVDRLRGLAGNEQLVAVAGSKDKLVELYKDWTGRQKAIQERVPKWELFKRLTAHARALPEAAELEQQMDAIVTARSLLVEPDPVQPLLQRAAQSLRDATTTERTCLLDAMTAAIGGLEAMPEWGKLPAGAGDVVLAQAGLQVPAVVDIGTPDTLLRTLDQTPLADWRDKLDALPTRLAQARETVAKLLEPKASRVTPRSTTLRTTDEADAYLRELRDAIIAQLGQGPVVIG